MVIRPSPLVAQVELVELTFAGEDAVDLLRQCSVSCDGIVEELRPGRSTVDDVCDLGTSQLRGHQGQQGTLITFC